MSDGVPSLPPRPLCYYGLDPAVSVRLATWDLLTRPDGMSVQRLRRSFLRLHGAPPQEWLALLRSCPYFEFFIPHRRPIRNVPPMPVGSVFCDGAPHPMAIQVSCARPGPLGNPFPITSTQSLEQVCAMFDRLLRHRERPSAISGIVHPAYASVEADDIRWRELDRLVQLVAHGASLNLRCAASCERQRRRSGSQLCHTVHLASYIRSMAPLCADQLLPVVPATFQQSVYNLDGATCQSQRGLRLLGDSRKLHVRRALPPAHFTLETVVARPSERLADALRGLVIDGGDAGAVLQRAQPLALAGAQGRLSIPAFEAPARFAHRNLEPRPDGETVALPPPRCNVPPVLPIEDPPPQDPPSGLAAESIFELLPADDVRRLRIWGRRADRSVRLASQGDVHGSRTARPSDLLLPRVLPPFAGIPMDLSRLPFRPLLPSRWPERPPSTEMRIRLWRREFRSHPAYTDRQLRGDVSHGLAEVAPCTQVTFLAAPHTSSYAHPAEWEHQMRAERERGWSTQGVPSAFGLVTLPQRCQPTSMVERHGKWRLCHDLSWPLPDTVDGVESPNEADRLSLIVIFATLGQFCFAVMIFLAAGLPVRVAKFDLSKAYKRCGQQAASRWRRTCWSSSGSQSLDRVCFGQRDGPSFFTRHSGFMVFIMCVELDFADVCYPSRCPHVAAFMLERRRAAVAAGASDADTWARLYFLFAMIDDFGLTSVNDLLFRVDGSRVEAANGEQRRRAWLHFDVCTSVVLRLGHRLEQDDPDKFSPPSGFVLLLGGGVDLSTEELVFDSDGPQSKRARYIIALRSALNEISLAVAVVLSLAYKMLVVCETHPYGRQRLHVIFRALRFDRIAPFVLAQEPAVVSSFQYFLDLLCSDARLAVPLSSRQSFPFAEVDYLLVCFADSSGAARDWAPVFASEEHAPGYGMWTVRGRRFYYVHGLFEPSEVSALSITVLELLASFWGEVIFSRVCPSVTHLLSFTDNTGAEWAMRRETPHAAFLQMLAERRSAFLHARRLFARSLRVPSASNAWADALSRQRVASVLAEALALGLEPVQLCVPADLRDVSWLISDAMC